MIYDTLAHRAQYYGLGERFQKALDYLAETDFSKLEDGRYDLDGDNLFVKLSTYTTKVANEKPEGHKAYIDIQFLIDGKESVGVAALEEMTEEVEAHPEKDMWRYRGPMDYITLTGDKFMIFWPGDAHAPSIAIGEQSTARKCLVKIKVD